MHPSDVADYVGDVVETVRHRLADRSELRAGALTLEEDVLLYIPITVVERTLLAAPIPTGLLGPGGQGTAVVHQVPDLGAAPVERELVLHMDLTNYDGDPPTAELLRPDLSPLPVNEWPKSLDRQGLVPDHPDYNRPFFCRRGLREYHSHPQHEDDPWDRHREGLALHSIIEELLVDLNWRLIGR